MLSLSKRFLVGVIAGVACHQLARWAAHDQQCGLERRSVLVASGHYHCSTAKRCSAARHLFQMHSVLAESGLPGLEVGPGQYAGTTFWDGPTKTVDLVVGRTAPSSAPCVQRLLLTILLSSASSGDALVRARDWSQACDDHRFALACAAIRLWIHKLVHNYWLSCGMC